MHRIFKLALGVACLSSFLGRDAVAQPFPSKPVRLIVSSAAGGSTDTISRILGQKLGPALGQSVVIDNRPGAGGNIGDDFVAKSTPDGYTLLMGAGSGAINVTLYRKLPFDLMRDLEPVIHVCLVTGILVVHPSLPVKSVKELIVLARAKPGQINYGSASPGTVTHLAGELFKLMAKVDLTHIAYRGSAPALNDLLGGHVSLMFANMPGTIQHVQTGRLRVIAVNSAQRSAVLPDVPTVSESGVPGFEAGTYFGVLAPAGTPKAVTAKLNAEIGKILNSPEMLERFAAEGAVAVGGTPEQFGAFLKREIEKWAKVVRASGAHVD